MGKEIDPEKLLDMIRSILPSTARVRARWSKRYENQTVRRDVRGILRNDDLETTKGDVRRKAHHSDMVMWRRLADKLSHFMRWCEAITRGMPEEEALGYVRGVLPANVIGDHAYGHWEVYRKHRGRHGISYNETRRRTWQSAFDRLRCRLRRAMEREPDLQGRLNATIKSRMLFEPRRLLLGIHDVDAFVNDILTRPEYLAERRIVEEMTERRASVRRSFFIDWAA